MTWVYFINLFTQLKSLRVLLHSLTDQKENEKWRKKLLHFFQTLLHFIIQKTELHETKLGGRDVEVSDDRLDYN